MFYFNNNNIAGILKLLIARFFLVSYNNNYILHSLSLQSMSCSHNSVFINQFESW